MAGREISQKNIQFSKQALEELAVLEDILTSYERSADHCSNVAVEMLQIAEGKLEAHEYLNALKGVQLQESAQFSERFKKYRAKYSFPDEQ